MRIKEELKIINSSGRQIIFSASSDYHVNIKRDVTGLSDASNELFTQRGLGQYGSEITGFQIDSRPIEISGALLTKDKAAVSQMRQNINTVMSPEEDLQVVYTLGGVERKIQAKAREIKFSAGEIYYTFYIALLCPNPLWTDMQESSTAIVQWQGNLEFPLEIPEGEWVLGYLDKKSTVTVRNSGDVSCGFKVVFKAAGTVKNPSITNSETGEKIKLNISMEKGDRAEVTTYYKDKKATLIKSTGETENIIGAFDLSSTFIQLTLGDNLFTYNADIGRDNIEIIIYHDNLYRGV